MSERARRSLIRGLKVLAFAALAAAIPAVVQAISSNEVGLPADWLWVVPILTSALAALEKWARWEKSRFRDKQGS